MLLLFHTHTFCADYMNTTVRQATNLHQSEFTTQSYSCYPYTLFLPSSYPFIFITCYWQMVSVPCPPIINVSVSPSYYTGDSIMKLGIPYFHTCEKKNGLYSSYIYVYTMCYYQSGGGTIVFAINGFDLI
jgi:hypothetical protein